MTKSNRWFLAVICTALLGSSLWGTPDRAQAAPSSEKAAAQAVVNVNKASVAELETVKGIGPMLAQRIITDREANGRFEQLDDLVRVPGIGQAKLEKIKSQLTL